MKTAIIFPAYNEEKTIAQVLTNFHSILPNAKLYIINNNSTDKTAETAENTLKILKAKGKVIFEARKGKANAVRRAFLKIKSDVYVICDADSTYSAKDLPALIEPIIKKEFDMTVGDRLSLGKYQKENKRRFHGFGNKLVIFLINFLFKAKLKDIMSGYRVFNRKFIKNYPILSEGFELETEMTLFALDHRFRIKEIPINYQDRPSGSVSKLNTVTDGLKVIKTILWIFKDYRPLLFFSFIGFIFALFSLIFGIPVIIEFLQISYITKVPSAILACGLMTIAFLCFTIGFVLDTVVKHNRMLFEILLKK